MGDVVRESVCVKEQKRYCGREAAKEEEKERKGEQYRRFARRIRNEVVCSVNVD